MIKIFTKRNVPKRLFLLCLCLYFGLSAYAQTPSVKGEVKDKKETIVGATVVAENIQTGKKTTTSTDKNGMFSFSRLIAGNYKFTINFIGYESRMIIGEVKDGGTFSLAVNLKESNIALDKEVIVTGTGINRNRNSFTGTTATFSGEALKAIGNNNVIQSLRTLDPSFILMENNLAGANPNILPQIEVRGKTSVPTATLKDQFGADPNQPLFILDGFETTLQNIVDLDINRVASVTILKDAASTALYGARASNGVVVVESLRPKSGELQFTYSNDLRIESPILSDYNMMNATEKLEFERLAGRYNYFTTPPDPSTQIYLEQLYNTHLAAVKRGVDTYWLNEPVQTGISENNSIFAQGGDHAFTYGVGFNYKNQTGAMKGSGRNTWSGNINLTYRKGKININNILYVRGYQSSESPYGSFSNFVNANPYYIKEPSQRYLEVSRTSVGAQLKVRNPLYDAFLPNTNGSKNLEVQNNLQVNYSITPDLQLRGGMQIVKGSVTSELFRAPESSEFEDVAVLQRGKYTNNKTDNFSYQANLLLTYGKVFGKHSVTANARAEINNRDYNSIEFTAEGFPEGSTGNPRFAYSYKANSAPTSASSVYRTANATLSANYAYDMRYLFDVSYRLDGSTAFGKNKQFSPYWSSGLGWNINREQFLSNAKWINRLKLYANIGVTGNQNYGNITSVSVYNYNSSTNYNQFGQGVSLATLGNPDLQPQKTTQISTGIDYSFFNDRVTGYVSFYNKQTNPLVVAVDLPSSTGVFSYPLNVGELNSKGMEFKIGYLPIYNISKRIIWTVGVSGGFNKGKYEGFGNILRSLNKQQENNKSLLRFTDGYSPDDIWAAKSLGIDPATGREVFLTTDGQYTFDYALGNVQAVGNTNPVIEGIFNTNFGYKGFNLGLYIRYRLGGDIFNTALYNKVENISYSGIALNQDRRALYDRWQKPGDIAQFKGISQTSTTPMSSRFVQEENTITGESISMGYTFDRQKWLNKVGLKTLNLSAITNDIFRISTVKKERGIDYPFANTVSFSLKASF